MCYNMHKLKFVLCLHNGVRLKGKSKTDEEVQVQSNKIYPQITQNMLEHGEENVLTNIG